MRLILDSGKDPATEDFKDWDPGDDPSFSRELPQSVLEELTDAMWGARQKAFDEGVRAGVLQLWRILLAGLREDTTVRFQLGKDDDDPLLLVIDITPPEFGDVITLQLPVSEISTFDDPDEWAVTQEYAARLASAIRGEIGRIADEILENAKAGEDQ